jgi:regulator of cell morphogenesis and NO signaling
MTTETASMDRPNKHQIPDPDWNAAPLRSLIKHIVETHHAYLQTELPALDKLIGRIAQQCSDGSILPDLHRAIKRLNRDLELQMRKEETILFPAILELEATVPAGGQPEYSPFGSVANLSRVTAQDHERAGRTLHEIRQLTNNYTCTNCEPGLTNLIQRLGSLTADLHRHIHLENNILFPRAIELERGKSRCQ